MSLTKAFYENIPVGSDASQEVLLIEAGEKSYGIFSCPERGEYWTVSEESMQNFILSVKQTHPHEMHPEGEKLKKINKLVKILSDTKFKNPVPAKTVNSVLDYFRN